MAAAANTRQPQRRRRGAVTKRTTAQTRNAAIKTAAMPSSPRTGKGHRIRPSDPRLRLSLRAFHQVLPRDPRQKNAAMTYGDHSDIFALLAAAVQKTHPLPVHIPAAFPPVADIGLYDPSSPWGVGSILYDPALPLPQNAPSLTCDSHGVWVGQIAAGPRPRQPISNTRGSVPSGAQTHSLPLQTILPSRQSDSHCCLGPGLREALRLIPSNVPVQIQASTPLTTLAIKQDPYAFEQEDRRHMQADMPIVTLESSATANTATTQPMSAPEAAPALAPPTRKRRRKPSLKALQTAAVKTKPKEFASPAITSTSTYLPESPLNTSNGGRRCCPLEVPTIMLMLLDRSLSDLQPHMVDQFREHVGSLCADHLVKYQRLQQSIGQAKSGRVLASALKAKAIQTTTPSPKRRKITSSTILPAALNPPTFTTHTSTVAGRPVLNSARDDAYRRRMRDEIQQRFDVPGIDNTHGGVTDRTIYDLLGVAKQPNSDPQNGPVDVHFLSGEEARDLLDAQSPQEPVVTQHEQVFQWHPRGRPIAELFWRMENLDRHVSVQVPSRDCMGDSFESRDLTEVRDRFLAAEGKEEEDPWNVLDLRSPLPAAVLPRFLTNENCQLLPRLRDEVLNPSRAERDMAARDQWNEWRDVLEWVLLSQGGHNTSPHTDSHGLGTWITVQEGLFGFGWLSRPTPAELAAWTAEPYEYVGARWCYLVLEPGQTIFFNSGTVHFVFRLRSQATLALGGHVLQWTGIERWLAVVTAQMQNPHITNEEMEWSAPRYVRVVSRLVAARLRTGRGINDMGGEAAVRRLLAQMQDFDEQYLKEAPAVASKAKPRKRRRRASYK